MQNKVSDLLPAIRQGKLSEAEIQELMSELRQAIQQNPAKGKELGRLIPLINQARKSQLRLPEISWLSAGNGSLAIGHKPGGKISFEGMKQAGVTAVLTLLQEKEGAPAIGKALERVSIEWLWFPFSASKPYEGKQAREVLELFRRMEELLQSGNKIYIHCSAGIHRTGMVTYGFLRYLGQERPTALGSLQKLRKVTAEQAGEERLQWGEQFKKGTA